MHHRDVINCFKRRSRGPPAPFVLESIILLDVLYDSLNHGRSFFMFIYYEKVLRDGRIVVVGRSPEKGMKGNRCNEQEVDQRMARIPHIRSVERLPNWLTWQGGGSNKIDIVHHTEPNTHTHKHGLNCERLEYSGQSSTFWTISLCEREGGTEFIWSLLWTQFRLSSSLSFSRRS